MNQERRRLHLVHGPTPIVRRLALDELVGAKVWVKRDDMTGGAEAGNKIRKLEFILADALAQNAEAVITCGGIQSNHARATSLVCAQLGLRAILFLRVADPERARRSQLDLVGNVLLDRMAGAEIGFVSPDEYRERNAIMEHACRELQVEGVKAYIVPEGGSNGLGALGYVEAMFETRRQIDLGLANHGQTFDVVAHACGSGGTAAGVALGAQHFGVARETWTFAVCDDRATFAKTISRIALELRGHMPELPPLAFLEPAGRHAVAPEDHARLIIDDRAKGPAYAVMDDDQKRFLVEVTRTTGLVLDPVYTGKALYGVAQAVARGEIARDANVLFLHTGGLPGLLAQGEELRSMLGH